MQLCLSCLLVSPLRASNASKTREVLAEVEQGLKEN